MSRNFLGLAVALLMSASAAAQTPAARHRQAVAANTAALRMMKTGQTARAAQRFRDALAFDPDYALAHYNLACASSILRDVKTALAELSWLAARGDDAVAKSRMEKARVDPDLDFVSALPRVRALLDVPAWAPEHVMAWLAERDGVWSAELPRSDCQSRSYSFQFASDGQLALTIREACDGEPARANTWEGHATIADDGTLDVAVPEWSQWPKSARLSLAACPGLDDAPASCFTLASDKTSLGPFHRGAAGTSPIVKRANLASSK
jgi:hypothetical protein